MNTYSAYKDSGEQWLGQIPEHWEIRKLKYVLQLRKKIVGADAKKYDLLSLTLKGVIKRDIENPTGKFPTTFDSYQEVNENDFIFCNFDNEETPRAVGLSPYRGMITGAYDVLRRIDEQCNDRFLLYYFLWVDDAKRFKPLYKGLRKTIPLDSFLSYKLALPPKEEQEAMVAYLDEQTGKIDAAIEREQKMIDLLNERKQIIIQQAVTKGLNPNAPLKDSGIEWIGAIPQSWKSIRLKYCMKIRNGQDYKHCVADFGYPVYGSGGQFAYASQYMYDGEVVFFGRKGTIDKPLYYKGKFWAVDTMFYAIPQKNIIGRFLYYAGRTIPFKYYSTSTALPSMTQTDLGNNPIALPPIEEQQNIVSYLDGKMGNIDRAIEAREKLISLLRERKQIIVNEVVTGKIKVS